MRLSKTVPRSELQACDAEKMRTYFAMLAYEKALDSLGEHSRHPNPSFIRISHRGFIADLITHHAGSGNELMSPVVVVWQSMTVGETIRHTPDVFDAWEWCTRESMRSLSTTDRGLYDYRDLAIKVRMKLKSLIPYCDEAVVQSK